MGRGVVESRLDSVDREGETMAWQCWSVGLQWAEDSGAVRGRSSAAYSGYRCGQQARERAAGAGSSCRCGQVRSCPVGLRGERQAVGEGRISQSNGG